MLALLLSQRVDLTMNLPTGTRNKARIVGFFTMLFGASIAMLSFSFLNNPLEKKEITSSKQAIAFELKQELPKPKQVKKKQKPESKPQKQLMPPAVALDMSLSGIDVGLGGFDANEIGEVNAGLLGNMNNVVMSSDMIDVAPRVRFKTVMEYPARAKAKEIEGFVTLSLMINTEGKVDTAKIIESEPAGIFDKTVLRTIKKWVFEPARYKGEPVQTWANQTIRFELG